LRKQLTDQISIQKQVTTNLLVSFHNKGRYDDDPTLRVCSQFSTSSMCIIRCNFLCSEL